MHDNTTPIIKLFNEHFRVPDFSDSKSINHFLKTINDSHGKKQHITLEVTNGAVTKLICARAKTDTLGREIIEFFPLFVSDVDRKSIRTDLVNIRKALSRKKSHVIVKIDPRQTEMSAALRKIGFKYDAHLMMRSVDKAKKYFEKSLKCADSNYSVKHLQVSDLRKISEIEIRAHASDKSSRVYDMLQTKKGAATFMKSRTWQKQLIKEKRMWGVSRGNELVGVIAVIYYRYDHRRLPLIATIAVHPDHQGRGLSKMLYRKALEDFSKHGFKFYYGATTTDRVLRAIKKIQGKAIADSLSGLI